MSTHSPQLGDKFFATVHDIADDGRSVITHPSGFTVFVAGLWLEEIGEFRLRKINNRWGEADLIELTQTSRHRVDPFCHHHGFQAGKCGGCPWQFVNYKEQLRVKQQRIESALRKFSEVTILSIKASTTLKNFRNRAQLKTDGQHIGYVSPASNTLAPIDDCPILTPKNRRTLRALQLRLPNDEWKPKKREPWKSLHIDNSIDENNVWIDERLPFQQSHHEQNQFMRQWLLQHCQIFSANDKVLELFCGSGNFTEILVQAGAPSVVAAEAAEASLVALREKNLIGVTPINVNLYADDAFTTLVRQHKFTTLVLDPPREGVKNIGELLKHQKKFTNVFYISCDLATFTRDVDKFRQSGYQLLEVQPVDVAPHTPHIELLAHLQWKGKVNTKKKSRPRTKLFQ